MTLLQVTPLTHLVLSWDLSSMVVLGGESSVIKLVSVLHTMDILTTCMKASWASHMFINHILYFNVIESVRKILLHHSTHQFLIVLQGLCELSCGCCILFNMNGTVLKFCSWIHRRVLSEHKQSTHRYHMVWNYMYRQFCHQLAVSKFNWQFYQVKILCAAYQHVLCS